MSDMERDQWVVRVFWTNSGMYGAPHYHRTEEGAVADAKSLLGIGYGKAENPVHIHREVVTLVHTFAAAQGGGGEV